MVLTTEQLYDTLISLSRQKPSKSASFFMKSLVYPLVANIDQAILEVSNLTSICRSNEACIWLNQNRWFCSWAALTPGRGSMILLFSQIYWRRTFLVRHESSILSWFSGAVTLSSCSQTFQKCALWSNWNCGPAHGLLISNIDVISWK